MTLDPKDWPAFRRTAHAMLDASLDKLEGAREGRVWTPVPKDLRTELKAPLPQAGISEAQMSTELQAIMPHSPGNTHPRFFGWVNGAGAPSNILAEMAGAAMNANCGGRNHVGPVIEQQVIRWAAQIMGMPSETTGLIASGTSMATIIALKVARDKYQAEFPSTDLIGYTGAQTHSCVRRAFDLLGIGTENLRDIPCNESFEIDLTALQAAIDTDRADGKTPFAIIGTAGAVNVGAIDDLDGLADLCEKENLWFHVDGAFGAAAILSESASHRLKGLARVDSLAFDFHKWWQVNYEAGCVLIRDPYLHRKSFADRPEYLRHDEDGLAGGDFWAVDYGPELSRSFRALKVWTHLKTHGIDAIAEVVERNISQAQYLKQRVEAEDKLELLAPVALNIVCFRYDFRYEPNEKNARIVVDLQESGIAAPSSTTINNEIAIRVNLTNHRTRESDLDILVEAVLEMGKELE